LPKSSEVIQIKNNEISLYKGELTTPVIINSVSRIRNAFPALPEGFYEVFSDRIKDSGFTDARLIDAVNSVIDNCVYPTPTIAQFISFDKRIKVFKYSEIVKMVDDGDMNAFNRYNRIEFEGLPEPVWIHINDIAKYKLKSLKT
jgi:hypothetical protein